ncbi:MAG: hypothetical protein IJJ29_04330 [Solobacterium sp.]|nr:hypothetical protein [Solobacterium sp.]
MMKKHMTEKLTVLLFLGFIGILSVCNLFVPQKTFSDNENRPLASFPPLSGIFSGHFDDDFETWFSDQFIARDLWIEAKSFVTLHTGSLQNNDVYKAEDGSLIRRFQTYDERTPMRNSAMIRTFLGEQNIHANMIIVPTAADIRKDVLPAGAWNLDQQKLLQELQEQFPDQNFPDLYTSLKETETELQQTGASAYFRTDHHWNEQGAFTAYNLICRDILHCSPHRFTYTKVSDDFRGTMYSRSGIFTTPGEPIMRFDTEGLTAKVTYEDGTVMPSLFSDKRLQEKDKYMYYLDGNHPYVRIETNAKGGHAVVIKDSYAHILVPYLAAEYSVIDMIDLRYYRDPVSELITDDTDVYFIYSLDNFCEDPYLAFLR